LKKVPDAETTPVASPTQPKAAIATAPPQKKPDGH
jgi:hypothetical protein